MIPLIDYEKFGLETLDSIERKNLAIVFDLLNFREFTENKFGKDFRFNSIENMNALQFRLLFDYCILTRKYYHDKKFALIKDISHSFFLPLFEAKKVVEMVDTYVNTSENHEDWSNFAQEPPF